MEEEKQEKSNSIDIPEAVIEERREYAKQKARGAIHTWKQKGGWVKCNSCDYPHAFRIESNKKMIGIDKETGMPVIVLRG